MTTIYSITPDGLCAHEESKLRMVTARVIELEKAGHQKILVGSDANNAVPYDLWKTFANGVSWK
jgi:hypothetical protein